jgi:hypothetical protein
MSGKGSGQVQETSAQVALAQHAQLMMDDYKKRWLPVQQNLASQIEAEGAPNSWQRAEAKGKASTDSAIQFSQAEGGVEKALSNKGVLPGSGRFDTAVTGMGADQAKSSGLDQMVSDQRITQAYTEGLGALTAIGQGQSAQVSNGMQQQARDSAMQAEADARSSLMAEEGIGGAVGTALGYAGQQGLKAWNAPPAPRAPLSAGVPVGNGP